MNSDVRRPRQIAIRFLSSVIACIVFASMAFLRVMWVGNSITPAELIALVTVCLLAIFDALVQFVRLWARGLGLTPITEIIRTDEKK